MNYTVLELFQYSCLENPVDGGAWWAAVHRVAQSQTRLKRFSSSSSLPGGASGKEPACQCRRLRFDPQVGKEEGMATHSTILAWRIPWTEEPGGLQSIGLQIQTLPKSQTQLKQRSTHSLHRYFSSFNFLSDRYYFLLQAGFRLCYFSVSFSQQVRGIFFLIWQITLFI